ncbi:MAG: 2-oxoglutarate dehydrogenase complex dihydrolipoyllysine-residue succinyltransferase [Pirellulaceae bacterium]|nr:2-oxoglutarate dehydrogenase complex dihydrolipoyllysine-residue succinyltransferase [Pirellulaceae bacterium]
MNDMLEIKIPEFGESIQEAQVSQWLVTPGTWVQRDQPLVELETEKASQEILAPEAGTLSEILVKAGEFVRVGTVVARLLPGPAKTGDPTAAVAVAASGAVATLASVGTAAGTKAVVESVMPAAERLLHNYQISADVVSPTGPGGRLLKEDVARFVQERNLQPSKDSTANQTASSSVNAEDFPPPPSTPPFVSRVDESRATEKKPMSMMRRTIAQRLVHAQQSAALLTTFNEIDMQPVMELRTRYKDAFQDKHGVKLGFMSFFAKASVEALRRFPAVNAYVVGTDVHYHNYFDIGVAIGGGKGLVVPVLRNAEKMSFAEIERRIAEFSVLAKDNKLKAEDLEGGTFTISNGGIYGSLLSTPIVNPPQSGILGLHAIQERPIAVKGQVVIRPMMYVALTYDHRLVDGREAVQFLKTIKEVLEEPARLFLEV